MDLLRLVAAFSSKLNILEIVFVATLTSALLSCRSHSQSVQAADVMQNRLGLFNAEEFDSNLYSVMISTEPVMATTATDVGGGDNTASKMVKESQDVDDREDEASKETEKEEKMIKMGVVSRYGQQYSCSIPDATPPHDTSDTTDPSDTADTSDTVGTKQFPNVSQLLAVMETRPCLVQTVGWWTYEYCHGQFMRQYHLEAGKPVGKTLYMGHYANETVWDKKTIDKTEGTLKTIKSTLPQKTQYIVHHTVFYNNGTECDITKKPRTTTVKISCGVSGEDKLVSVQEGDTCNYVVIVRTSLLCNIPIFSNAQRGKEMQVKCSPVVSEEKYQDYLRKQEEMKEKILKKKRLMEAQLSAVSGREDELLDGQSTLKDGQKRLPVSPKSPPSGSSNGIAFILSEVLSQMDKTEYERTRLLKKLISKVQPELMPEEVEDRVEALQEKFESFNLEQLRQLVGEPPDLTEGAVEETPSLDRYNIEEYLDGDEQALLDSLDLDDEELEELAEEVTAELHKKLAEMGLPADGTKVKIKVMKFSDVDWDKDFDDESNIGDASSDLEGTADDRNTPLGSDLSREKKTGVKTMSMRLMPDFDHHGTEDGSGPEKRRKTSALEAGYNSFWEEDREHQRKKKTQN